MISHLCDSLEQTMLYAYNFGRSLPEKSIVCFYGDLGAGKTTFVKGLAQGAANINPDLVSSPTFVYLNIYKGEKTIYHFDLYRLKDADEFLSMGFDEILFDGGICCIEWSERISALLPEDCIKIELMHQDGNKRLIRIS